MEMQWRGLQAAGFLRIRVLMFALACTQLYLLQLSSAHVPVKSRVVRFGVAQLCLLTSSHLYR